MLLRILLLLFCCAAHICKAQIPKQGLSLWLKADAGVQAMNGEVIAWKDQSGNNHIATTKTAHHPKLIPNIANGQAAIRFDGFDNGMETGAVATFPLKRGAVIVVARYAGRSTTSGAGYGTLVGTYHGKQKRNVWQFGLYPQTFGFYDGIGGRSNEVAHQALMKWQMIALVREGDSTISFYNGGRKKDRMTVTNVVPDTNTIKIGFNGKLVEDSIPEVLNGEIAEIIIYDRALNEAELEAVHLYLSEKYAIPFAPPPYQQRWWFYPALLLAASIMGAAISRFVSARKFRKQLAAFKQQAAVEAERYRISRDMHDEIGSGLTHIALMSELIQTQKKAEEELRKDVGDISASARKLVESMSEIIWALNPQNDSLENLLAYLREQTMKYFEPFKISYAVHFPQAIPDIHLTNEQRRNLFLVAKESLNNALKHSGADRISLSMEIKEDHLHFFVRDNGRGFEAGKTKAASNGLKNMRKRMDDVNGNFEIITNDTGTLVHFWMKSVATVKSATTYFTLPNKN